MTRIWLVLAFAAACEQLARSDVPPAPSPLPVPVMMPSAPRTIHLVQQGLGEWHGSICGCIYTVDVDLIRGTLTATDPGGTARVRMLGPGALRELAELATTARTEPATKQSQATDYNEQLDIFDGHTTFHVENQGQIERPIAARLVEALAERAHWPAS